MGGHDGLASVQSDALYDFQRALGLIGPVTVSIEADGSLLMAAARTGTMRLVPAGRWLYRDELGSDLVACKTDASGPVVNAFVGSLPMMVMERVAWYQSARLHRNVLGLAAAVFILTVWSALARVSRRFSQARGDDILPGRGFVVGAALADLTFIVLIAVLMSNATALMTGSSAVFEVALALPVVAAARAIAAAVVAVRQWFNHANLATSRLRYAAVVVIVLLFTSSLNEWNLLGWRF